MTQAEQDKRQVLIEYAKRFGVTHFIETGTYKGDTVKAMVHSRLFKQIHTIDVYIDRATRAANRYKDLPHVHCWCGDSAKRLPTILRNIHEPTLFWLDAHHSGKQIARKKGLIETPLLGELRAILDHPQAAQHVILIDDARYFKKFGGKYKGYPTEDEAKKLVKDKFPDWVWENKDDIIRTHRHEDDEAAG